MNSLFFSKIRGCCEYRYRLKKDSMRLLEIDVHMPPLYFWPHSSPEFLLLKGELVVYTLDRRLAKGITSAGVSSLIPQLLETRVVSSHSLMRLARKLSGLDGLKNFWREWIETPGMPIIELSYSCNVERQMIEFNVAQRNTSLWSTEGSPALAEERNVFTGSLAVAIYELDGATYKHIFDLTRKSQQFEVRFNSRHKYRKRMSKAIAEKDLGELSLKGIAWIEHIMVDPEFEWPTIVGVCQTEDMWKHGLENIFNVAFEFDAIMHLSQIRTRRAANVLELIARRKTSFIRVRCGSIYALSAHSGPELKWIGFDILCNLFSTCERELELLNNPSPTVDGKKKLYCALLMYNSVLYALSNVRNTDGICPNQISSMLLSLLGVSECNHAARIDREDQICILIDGLLNSLLAGSTRVAPNVCKYLYKCMSMATANAAAASASSRANASGYNLARDNSGSRKYINIKNSISNRNSNSNKSNLSNNNLNNVYNDERVSGQIDCMLRFGNFIHQDALPGRPTMIVETLNLPFRSHLHSNKGEEKSSIYAACSSITPNPKTIEKFDLKQLARKMFSFDDTANLVDKAMSIMTRIERYCKITEREVRILVRCINFYFRLMLAGLLPTNLNIFLKYCDISCHTSVRAAAVRSLILLGGHKKQNIATFLIKVAHLDNNHAVRLFTVQYLLLYVRTLYIQKDVAESAYVKPYVKKLIPQIIQMLSDTSVPQDCQSILMEFVEIALAIPTIKLKVNLDSEELAQQQQKQQKQQQQQQSPAELQKMLTEVSPSLNFSSPNQSPQKNTIVKQQQLPPAQTPISISIPFALPPMVIPANDDKLQIVIPEMPYFDEVKSKQGQSKEYNIEVDKLLTIDFEKTKTHGQSSRFSTLPASIKMGILDSWLRNAGHTAIESLLGELPQISAFLSASSARIAGFETTSSDLLFLDSIYLRFRNGHFRNLGELFESFLKIFADCFESPITSGELKLSALQLNRFTVDSLYPRIKAMIPDPQFIIMGEECRKKLMRIIKKLAGRSCAVPFLELVNTNAEYFKNIEHPIDIGTIMLRVERKEYPRLSFFVQDMERLKKNCERFYPKGHPILTAMKSLFMQYERELRTDFPDGFGPELSAEDEIASILAQGSHLISKPISAVQFGKVFRTSIDESLDVPRVVGEIRQVLALKNLPNGLTKSSYASNNVKGAANTSSTMKLSVPINSSSSTFLPQLSARAGSSSTGDKSLASLKVNFGKVHELLLNCSDSLDFLVPVDPIALGIPTYFHVIKNPMDLRTIAGKFQYYKTHRDYLEDLVLMLRNAITFNAPTAPAHIGALQFYEFIKATWRKFFGDVDFPILKPHALAIPHNKKHKSKSEMVPQTTKTAKIKQRPQTVPQQMPTMTSSFGNRIQMQTLANSALNAAETRYSQAVLSQQNIARAPTTNTTITPITITHPEKPAEQTPFTSHPQEAVRNPISFFSIPATVTTASPISVLNHALAAPSPSTRLASPLLNQGGVGQKAPKKRVQCAQPKRQQNQHYMTANCYEKALKITKKFCGMKNAQAFVEPVDPVKLGIPQYFDIITEPMDLQTVHDRVETRRYRTLEEFERDFCQIFNNCVTFNGKAHALSKVANILRTSFSAEMKSLHKIWQQDYNEARRVAPPSKLGFERGFARMVVATLRKHESGKPFLEPVDPVRLNAPTYYDIIKHPMDLRTVMRKTESSQYQNMGEFVEDVLRIYSNCFEFNRVGDVVYEAGRRNLQRFEQLCKKGNLCTRLEGESVQGAESEIDKFIELSGNSAFFMAAVGEADDYADGDSQAGYGEERDGHLGANFGGDASGTGPEPEPEPEAEAQAQAQAQAILGNPEAVNRESKKRKESQVTADNEPTAKRHKQ